MRRPLVPEVDEGETEGELQQDDMALLVMNLQIT